MRLQHREPERARVVLVERVAERGEVAERLRHLLAADGDHAAVHPVARERVARAFGLRALVLVVREHEVVAAAVEVEAVAEDLERHRRALDVPARPARPHGESHAGSPGFAAFQSAKSTGLRFASSTSTRAPADSEQLVERAVRQRAVAGEASRPWKYTPCPSTTYA